MQAEWQGKEIRMTLKSNLSKAEVRTQTQRSRILCAATTCFVQSGFHSASMAKIADTAGMSPGLIYRYFDSKDSIILAIIEQQLEESRSRIQGLQSTDDLTSAVMKFCDTRDCAVENSASATLFLEMSAEAMRNGEIAAALGRYDQAIRTELADWIGRIASLEGHQQGSTTTKERALGLVCLLEGLKFRKTREPDLDHHALRNVIEIMIRSLMN